MVSTVGVPAKSRDPVGKGDDLSIHHQSKFENHTEIMQLIRRILERTSGRTSGRTSQRTTYWNNIRNKPRAGPKGNSSQTNTFHPRIVVDNLLASEYFITSL
jgi:hypothetical protein